MKRILSKRTPEDLKNHLLNIEIYGDKPDKEFVKLIEENGITEPIVVNHDDVIISGHRRNQAAKILGLKEVPVYVVNLDDPLEVEKLLIISNKQREKSNEIKAREFKKLKRIEEKLAAKRMKSGKAPDPVVNLTQGQKSLKSRDIAAEKVGMSGSTAEAAAEVVDKIDELEAEGETEQANELRETLNKSVSGAKKKASGKKSEPKQFKEKDIDDPLGKLIRAVDARYDAKGGRKEQGACLTHLRAFNAALKTWRAKG